MGLAERLHDLSYRLAHGSCVLCARASGRQLDLCAGCEADLPWVRPQDPDCQLCGEPDSPLGLCHQCRQKPPPNDGFAAAFRYDFPIDVMVQRFKTGHMPFGRVLAELLAARAPVETDGLVPVPLSPARQRQRGFNQAAMIAAVLAHRQSLPLLDIARAASRSEQKALTASQRRRNIKGVFSLDAGARLHGQRLTIVDDVYTTGATTCELARLLKRAGAEAVHILTLARTPSPTA